MNSTSSVLVYAKFPLWTLWQCATHPVRAFENSGLILHIFFRTVVIGRAALCVLRRHGAHCSFTNPRRQSWSVKTRGRYIWRVAQLFWARWIIDRANVCLELVGYENIDWSHPHIVVSNHQSTIDPIIFVAILKNGRYVAKKEILSYPIIGKAAEMGAQIIIDRNDHTQAMRAIREAVDVRMVPRHRRQWNENLIFFAEGKRTRDGSLGDFKMGAFRIACETGFPILPFAITGAYEALPKGSLLRLRRGARIRVECGKEILPNGNDAYDLMTRTRSAIAHMIAKHSTRSLT